MAQFKFALGSVLGTVSTAAETIDGTFKTVGNTVGMFNEFVSKHADEQKRRYAIDKETSNFRIAQEAADEMAVAKEIIEQKCENNERYAEHFKSSFDRFMDILEPKADKSLRVING